MGKNIRTPSWVTLTPNERIVWNGRPSLRSAIWVLVGSLISVSAGIGGFVVFGRSGGNPLFKWLSVVPLAIGFLSVSLLLVRRWSNHYVLTTKAVYKRTGLLSRTVSKLRRDRIQHTSYTQSLTERLLSYGTVTIGTASSRRSEIILAHIPDPSRVTDLISNRHHTIDSLQPGQIM